MDESFQSVKYNTSAFGIGPVFMIRCELIRYKLFYLSIDALGGVILYHTDFPLGGDKYNFMWKIGPSIGFDIADKYTINVAFRGMHVSNGQGVADKNPSYEALGFSIDLIFHL
ncbi:MAG: acyloxyacyl hydrolase [bacterium]|nr:acyloxyacyl hydrolase [bacterium]